MSDHPIDAAVYNALKATTGAEFVVELANTFLEEGPSLLADLRNARTDGDGDRFRRAAHTMKSNANTFGATQLAAAARALELGGFTLDAARDDAAIVALGVEFSRVADALKALPNG